MDNLVPITKSIYYAVGSIKMVLPDNEIDQSDDDHSYEFIDSDDLHTVSIRPSNLLPFLLKRIHLLIYYMKRVL